MSYVLRNGKRYYQDAEGYESIDNVSQEEADRRAGEDRLLNSARTCRTCPLSS